MAGTGPKPTNGWVYIIANDAWPGFVKVGCAVDLKDRLKVYQTGSPFRDYHIVAAHQFADRRHAERRLRDDMRGHRVGRTEWHQVHPSDARNMLERLKKMET